MKNNALYGVTLAIGGFCLAATVNAAEVPGTFPYCAWWLETTPETMNVAYPDTEATYWTTPFIAKTGLKLKIKGQFPQARYFSLTVYDNSFGYFTTSEGVSSGIADYLIVPDSGSVNPWQSSDAASGGSFTVTVEDNVTQAMYETENTIPISPSTPVSGKLPSDIRFLIFRTYVPAGGAAQVSLPTVTIDDGTQSTDLALCSASRLKKLAKLSKDVAKVTKAIKGLRTRTSQYEPPCNSSASGCPPLMEFFLPSSGVTSTVFPNPDNAYISALFVPKRGEVVVVRGLAPSSPSAVGTGSVGDAVGASPVNWPQTEYQVRYWSIANNVYKKPYPVVTFGRGKRVVYGGAPDLSTPLDTEGRYNVVISHPADKPKNATVDNGIAWLPTQVDKPRAWETLIMRNMLPNSSFTNAIQQIPSSNYGDPAAAQSVMGDYYPSIASCTRAVFEKGGPDACFVAYQGRK
ncbi:hypothetical protein [Methyloterricola oryzae]|uniref:hypothetical protein n=1 Tax=Methyloterricola oryzae TaxID=1495050 RepID=UPI0005EB3B9C|nr:hypothetical protein [Methyloterricola oryzae]